MTAGEREALRRRLHEWLVEEAIRVGPDRIRRSDAAELLLAAGLSRSTAFAWIAEMLAGGTIGQEVARRLRTSADERAAAAGVSLAEDAARQAGEALPDAPSIADAIKAADRAVDIIAEMATAIADVKQVRGTAFTEDGRVRNARMLLRAAEAMRRNLETAVRLQQAMMELGQVERFHQAVVAEIAKESPELAQRVVARLNMLASVQLGAKA